MKTDHSTKKGRLRRVHTTNNHKGFQEYTKPNERQNQTLPVPGTVGSIEYWGFPL